MKTPYHTPDRLRKSEWEVRPVDISTARQLVERYHYARGASNTAVYLHGLFPAGAFWSQECVGVAWWLPPTKPAALATYPDNWRGVLSLSRLVIAPDIPKNACSFLLSRSVRLIPCDVWPCLVTYADQWRGHEGGIYRAANWEYVGLTSAEATYTKNGVLMARKAGPKSRTHTEMIDLGCIYAGRHAKHKFRMVRSTGVKTMESAEKQRLEWRSENFCKICGKDNDYAELCCECASSAELVQGRASVPEGFMESAESVLRGMT